MASGMANCRTRVVPPARAGCKAASIDEAEPCPTRRLVPVDLGQAGADVPA